MRSGKQVFTGFITLLVLVGTYFLYGETIGRFTDFPEVTQDDLTPILDNSPDNEPIDDRAREANIAAQRAFGPDCPEQEAAIKWESFTRNGRDTVAGRGLGLFLYIQNYKPLENRCFVELTPFSLVYIHKTGDGDAETDSIETIRGDRAIIEFDRPIDFHKMTQPKAIGGWVMGNVELKTNRRTASNASDDIVVYTDKLHYSASRNLIWADDRIRVISNDMRISGVGMELGLYPESQEKLKGGNADEAPVEEQPERKSDFKYVRLMENVRFDLQLENSDDLFGSSDSSNQEASARVPVTVTSLGPFHFDAETQVGTFEKIVQMLRLNPPKKPGDPETTDNIHCDRLVLQFVSKEEQESAEPAKGKLKSETQELVLANATATGREVLLFSDSQNLQATGNYLYYDAQNRQATLRGEKEMIAVHNNTIIHSRSLVIEQAQGEKKGIQKLTADGPNGWLEMLDKDSKQPELKIRWQGRLQTSGKGDGDTQHVVIRDGVELEHVQFALKSNLLKVWLIPVEEQAEGTTKTRWEPIKLEAQDNVSASSEEMAIVTENLTMDIIRRAVVEVEEPVHAASQETEVASVSKGAEVKSTDEKSKDPKKPGQKDKATPEPEESEPEEKQPLAVQAERVAVVVERQGSKSKPVSAWAEGNVYVNQAPKSPDDDPLEIRGQTLHFDRKTDGEIIQVGGGSRRVAVIKTTGMELAGRDILMNEIINKVEVTGAGYLIRETHNDLTGKAVEQPQWLRIDWTQQMIFDGRLGTFFGDVKAQQGTSEIQCELMDVTFDQFVNFKEARAKRSRKQDQRLQIQTVVCDKDVVVVDIERDGGNLIRRSILEARDLRYDNLDRAKNTMIASGPGRVHLVERNKPKEDENGKLVPPEDPYDMSIVVFQGQMTGNQIGRTATFYDNVHIVHLPVSDPNYAVDEQNLPENGIIIDAVDEAIMGETQLPNGEKDRQFKAIGNVKVHARKYWAQCDELRYDQQKDLLVFDSKPGRMATLYRREQVGQEYTSFRAAMIMYRSKTDKWRAIDSDGLNGLSISPGE